MGQPTLILASASPRRRELIARLGVTPAAIVPADIDETPHKGELPRDYARRMACEKAEAAASDEPEDSAYSRVLSGLTDGLTRHLNNQLKEACPQPPSQREAYRPQNRHRKKRCVNPAHEPAHVGAPDQQPSSPMQTDGSGHHGTAQVRVS